MAYKNILWQSVSANYVEIMKKYVLLTITNAI